MKDQSDYLRQKQETELKLKAVEESLKQSQLLVANVKNTLTTLDTLNAEMVKKQQKELFANKNINSL